MTTAEYRVEAHETSFEPSKSVEWKFDVVGPQGPPGTYRIQHEREIHLIIVRNDLSTFAHLHPVRDDDGGWSVELSLPKAGAYTAFADVAPNNEDPMTLRLPIHVEGELGSDAVHEPSRIKTVDGYEVAVEGDVVAGSGSQIEFRITNGEEVIEPDLYLGAAGHLVAIRIGDLEYLHVHPLDGAVPGSVPFMIHAPGPGLYRLFLQFAHGGEVRTADFTVEAVKGKSQTPSAHHE